MIHTSSTSKKKFLTFNESKVLVASTLRTGRGIEMLNKIINEKYLLRKEYNNLKLLTKLGLLEKQKLGYSLWFIERKIRYKLIITFNEFYYKCKISECVQEKKKKCYKNYNGFKKVYGLFKLESIIQLKAKKLVQIFFSKFFVFKELFLYSEKGEKRTDNVSLHQKETSIVNIQTNCTFPKDYEYYKCTNYHLHKKFPLRNINCASAKEINYVYDNNYMENKKTTKQNYSLNKSYTLLPLIPYYYDNLPSIKMSHHNKDLIKNDYIR
ncbi:conserved Plasmodium protein, unknown function [Plasmodium malariae]|uniref:Uncharacterized protein n=1 Tax=Plasmodium malariae TaxID=5858 RepID=A0A1C3KY19_PLAMA|nr:conserved Plasmodium protein, unknown function [Plasmodium malariae]